MSIIKIIMYTCILNINMLCEWVMWANSNALGAIVWFWLTVLLAYSTFLTSGCVLLIATVRYCSECLWCLSVRHSYCACSALFLKQLGSKWCRTLGIAVTYMCSFVHDGSAHNNPKRYRAVTQYCNTVTNLFMKPLYFINNNSVQLISYDKF